jgi:hypothetical protein
MSAVFVAFLIASILHMTEEYFFPGGFMEVMKSFNPRFAPYVTMPMAIVINGLQLMLCVLAVVVGNEILILGMSAAALLFINGLMHVGASICEKGYVPGMVTGLLLYMPISAYAYYRVLTNGRLTTIDLLITVALGIAYQLVPIGYLVATSVLRKG